jgi:hypothetical protein
MNPETFFKHCWADYVDVAPQAPAIWNYLNQLGNEITIDHIAMRTFAWKGLDLEAIASELLHLGYHPKEKYHFEAKNLTAQHFDAGEDLPLIFVSEFSHESLPTHLKERVEKSLNKIHEPLSLSRLAYFRPWPVFEKEEIDEIWKHSEYAGWLLCHGLRVNHYTVNVNQLKLVENLESLNEMLKKKGFNLNTSGGEIKGSPLVGLTQSSTMAPLVEVRLGDGHYKVPGCYVEFAERFELNAKLFRGFLGDSADKIFESTHR